MHDGAPQPKIVGFLFRFSPHKFVLFPLSHGIGHREAFLIRAFPGVMTGHVGGVRMLNKKSRVESSRVRRWSKLHGSGRVRSFSNLTGRVGSPWPIRSARSDLTREKPCF